MRSKGWRLTAGCGCPRLPPDWAKGAELLDIAHYEGMNWGAYCCCKACDRAYLDNHWWPHLRLIVPAPLEIEDQHFTSGYEE
jgi:hypothetical protein